MAHKVSNSSVCLVLTIMLFR